MEEIEALKVAGAAIAQKSDGRTTSYDEDEDVVDIKDLYLAGRLLPKKGHFQIDADGSSSIHEDGVNLRLDPGTSPSPLGGDNDLLVNLAGYSCSKFYGSLRITKERPVGAKGITFFTFQDEKNIGSVLVGGRTPKEFPFRYGLDPEISNISLRVHDHGTPDKDFFELEGYLSCKVDCSGRALDTDTGSCESLTDDRVRCEGAADPHGRPCRGMGPAASASNLVAVRVTRCVTRSWTAPMTAAGARTTTPAPSGLIALQHSVVGRTRTRNASRQALTARHRMECATEPPQRLRASIRSMSRKERRMATTWSRDIS